MKIKQMALLCLLILNSKTVSSKTVDADEYFKRWAQIQHVLNKIDLCEMKNGLTFNQLQDLKSRYNVNLHFLKTLIRFFDLKSSKNFEGILAQNQLPNDYKLKDTVNNIYELIQNDFQGFVESLKEKGIGKAGVHSEEERINMDILASKYWAILSMLFIHQDQFKSEKIFFALGDKTFEYCFYPKTFDDFKELISNKNYHGIARLVVFFLWKTLVNLGWKWWHQDVLDAVKKTTDNNGQMVYIAGGSDIYTPIKHGIYNIKVIDPMLPTQDRYYSQDWQWLVEPETGDGIGDNIEFVLDEAKVNLKRIAHKVTGNFNYKSWDGKKTQIPQSVTTWKVTGPEYLKKGSSNKIVELGKVIYERKMVKQEDFTAEKNKAVVMSLTEQITAIKAPKMSPFGMVEVGWGIDPSKFGNNLQVYIKQLSKPINKQILKNLRWSGQHVPDLGFIQLDLDPT